MACVRGFHFPPFSSGVYHGPLSAVWDGLVLGAGDVKQAYPRKPRWSMPGMGKRLSACALHN